MQSNSQLIFEPRTVQFVTAAAEFCGMMERAHAMTRPDFVEKALKMLPTLYLTALALPPCERMGEEEPETFVDETDYERVRTDVAGVMGNQDDYLEVFLSEMAYSDTPICKNISEDLADIYQDLKDFIGAFQLGMNETMHDALAICREHFADYWGQRLVNTLRALHNVKFGPDAEDEMGEQN